MNRALLRKGLSNPRRIPSYLEERISKISKRTFYRFRSLSNTEITTKAQNHRFVLNPNDLDISVALYFDGIYDAPLTNVLANEIDEGDVAIDVGANLGYVTVLMGEYVGEAGRVVSFEPHPKNFRLLNKNINQNDLSGSIEVYQEALADSEGTVTLYEHPTNKGAHSIFRKDLMTTDQAVSHEVSTAIGDDVLPELVDFIKIDTEGAEPVVIKGIERTVKREQPTLIFEYDSRLWDENGKDTFGYLGDIGYEFRILTLNSQNYTEQKSVTEILDRERANVLAKVPGQ